MLNKIKYLAILQSVWSNSSNLEVHKNQVLGNTQEQGEDGRTDYSLALKPKLAGGPSGQPNRDGPIGPFLCAPSMGVLL